MKEDLGISQKVENIEKFCVSVVEIINELSKENISLRQELEEKENEISQLKTSVDDILEKERLEKQRLELEKLEREKISNRFPCNFIDTRKKEQIFEMLPSELKNKSLKLVHDLKRHSQRNLYHTALNGQGSSLIILKSNQDFIFGAFISESYCGGGWLQSSTPSFIFSFGNNNTPLKLVYSGSGNSVYVGDCGLHMGSGNDLVAFCSGTQFTCNPGNFKKVAEGYSCPNLTNCTVGGAANGTLVEGDVYTFY